MQACSHVFAAEAHEANRICPMNTCFSKSVQRRVEHITDMHLMYTRHEFKTLVRTLVLSAVNPGLAQSLRAMKNGRYQAWQALAGISVTGEDWKLQFDHSCFAQISIYESPTNTASHCWVLCILLCHRREPRSCAAQSLPSGCQAGIQAACIAALLLAKEQSASIFLWL